MGKKMASTKARAHFWVERIENPLKIAASAARLMIDSRLTSAGDSMEKTVFVEHSRRRFSANFPVLVTHSAARISEKTDFFSIIFTAGSAVPEWHKKKNAPPGGWRVIRLGGWA